MVRKKGSELACQMRELDVSFHVTDGLAILLVFRLVWGIKATVSTAVSGG
jgi:hypothetical protein